MPKKTAAQARKAFYLSVERFAAGSTGGGHWEDNVLIEKETPEEAFEDALDYLRKQGYASRTTLRFCEHDGEDFR